jgi:hypothetical protein
MSLRLSGLRTDRDPSLHACSLLHFHSDSPHPVAVTVDVALDHAAQRLARMGAGAAAGAKNAVQGLAGNPAMPFSASVGTSGNSAARFALVMPIARSRPTPLNPRTPTA